MHLFVKEFPETPPYNGQIAIENLHAHINVSSNKSNIDKVKKEVSCKMKSIVPYTFQVNEIRINIKYEGKWIKYKNFKL